MKTPLLVLSLLLLFAVGLVPGQGLAQPAPATQNAAEKNKIEADLCRTWKIEQMLMNGQVVFKLGAAQNRVDATKVRHTYKPDNTYETLKGDGTKSVGKWELREANTKITLTVDGQTKQFQVQKITATRVELQSIGEKATVVIHLVPA
ncbi:MAG: hypothetical protein MUC97_02335 [Bernardetiaceae bacterium]|jgi:hypothetical protein|nr:hypothetical protein [Bernardetiaceae bacterium]